MDQLGWSNGVGHAATRVQRSQSSSGGGACWLGSRRVDRARDLAEELASQKRSLSEEVIRKIWLYLILRWLFENRERAADPFALVDELYSDFDYPDEIAPFVRYMPPEDGYDPSKHSETENYDHMLQQWRDYLIAAEKQFDSSPA